MIRTLPYLLLRRALGLFRSNVKHYVEARPHRGLGLATPRGTPLPLGAGLKTNDRGVTDVLGSLIHEDRDAA